MHDLPSLFLTLRFLACLGPPFVIQGIPIPHPMRTLCITNGAPELAEKRSLGERERRGRATSELYNDYCNLAVPTSYLKLEPCNFVERRKPNPHHWHFRHVEHIWPIRNTLCPSWRPPWQGTPFAPLYEVVGLCLKL